MKLVKLSLNLILLLLSSQLTAQYEFERFDLSPSGNSDPNSFYEWNGKFYFSANDGINGFELWVSDGSETGTSMLKNINPGNGHSSPSYFTHVNNKLIFLAQHPDHGLELWSSDGTEQGTNLLKDINPGFASSFIIGEIIELNNRIYFNLSHESYGFELWSSDGTASGTFMVKDIYPGINSGFFGYELKKFNDKLYFLGVSSEASGEELWVSDGTTVGTYMVKDINVGSGGSLCQNFIEWNNELYFSAVSSAWIKEIWKTDGTEFGTELFLNSTESIHSFYAVGDYIYFDFFNATTGSELWRSTTNPDDKQLISDFFPGASNSNLAILGHFGDILYVKAKDSESAGMELFGIDLQTLSMTKLTELQYLDYPTNIRNFVIYSNTVFFIGNRSLPNPDPDSFEDLNESNLYRTDGTIAGTYFVTPLIAPITGPLNFTNELFVFDNALFFSAFYDENGQELWRLKDPSLGYENTTISTDQKLIYPNPCNEIVNVYSGETIRNILVYNVDGKEMDCIIEKTAENIYSINTSTLESGIYFIEIETSLYKKAHRIIVQK